jgi:ParB family chromosome partitioning protein
MARDGKPRGLGRGLSALLGEEPSAADLPAIPGDRPARVLPIEALRPGRAQPRRRMAEQDLSDLARSIAEQGVLQPILVRPHPDDPDAYEIVAGERRWRAAQLAQIHEVPVSIRSLTDREALEVALVENLQRQDLSPLEEADGYRRLVEEHGYTQDDVAQHVGKSRSHVANTLRLLALPDGVKALLEEQQLSAGHARALLTASDPETLARQVVDRALNVRETEKLASAVRTEPPRAARRPPTKDPDTVALERDLGNLLGLAVEIRFRGSGGSLLLHYTSVDQLDDILRRLRSEATRSRAEPI